MTRRSQRRGSGSNPLGETLASVGELVKPPGLQPGKCGFEFRRKHSTPHRLAVRTGDFQSPGSGSNPLGETSKPVEKILVGGDARTVQTVNKFCLLLRVVTIASRQEIETVPAIQSQSPFDMF